MPIVAVYKFRALFRSPPPHDPSRVMPPEGLSHQGLLLLRQERDERDDAAAIAACAQRSAFDATIERYATIDPAVLGNAQNRAFVPLHATALREGSAMMYYPDVPPDAAP